VDVDTQNQEIKSLSDDELDAVSGGAQDLVVAQMWTGSWVLTVSATANSHDSALFIDK
jgi:bacteriocin-like protein